MLFSWSSEGSVTKQGRAKPNALKGHYTLDNNGLSRNEMKIYQDQPTVISVASSSLEGGVPVQARSLTNTYL